MTRQRLNAQDAAAALGISVDAVRMRARRGSLESEHDANGRLYVWLDIDEPQPDSAALISELRAHNATLREQLAAERRANDENRRLLAAALERIPAIEAPAAPESPEPRESPVTFRVGRERADPGEEARGQQEPTERPRQRSSWRAPVDKLPSWQYLLGLGLIAGLLLVLTLDFFYKLDPAGIRTYLFWAVPAVFGFWVGLKRRHLSLWRNLFPIGLMAGATAAVATVPIQGTTGYSSLVEFSLSIILFIFVPTLMLYISGAIIGRAFQRRTAGAYASLTQDTEAPPSAPRHRTLGDRWSPRKQAILGFSGTVVAALVSVVGQIVVAGMGGGG